VGCVCLAGAAQAQQSPAPPPVKAPVPQAQKKAAPPQSQAPAQQGQAQGEQPQQDAWVKLCEAASKTDSKQICLIHHERIDGNTGMVIVSAAIRQIEGQEKEELMVMVPLGMALPPGAYVRVDDGQPIQLKYTLCHVAGCTAEVEAPKGLVDSLKKGKQMMVAAVNVAGKPIGFPVPLTGFTKAYQGPPMDNEKYREARKQLLMQIRERQIELAKKAAEGSENKTATKQAEQKAEPPKR
jgi:invasion protein IalB